MGRPRVPGSSWCKELSPRQLAALMFLADCPCAHYTWAEGYKRRPSEFHASTLRSLKDRGLISVRIKIEPWDGDMRRRISVLLTTGGRALIAAYRYGYDAGIEAE